MKIEKFLPKSKKNISLAQQTTFGIGGRAKYFLEAKKREELIEGIRIAKKLKIPFFILGNGSNILVADKGYDGLVIKMLEKQVLFDETAVMVTAGTPLSFLITACFKKGLSGLEWATGIPGTVGGAIYGNAGGFGSAMSEVTVIVKVFNTKTNQVKNFKNKECQFNYRESIFKKNPHLIIIEVGLKLKPEKKIIIKDKIKKCLQERVKRQPQGLSAGSIFKNYQIKGKAEKVKLIKKFPELEKVIAKEILPAGFLIERCGLKGKTIGKVMISHLHSNFIINLGKGKATDVKKLIYLIKQRVRERFDISLVEEIIFVGF